MWALDDQHYNPALGHNLGAGKTDVAMLTVLSTIRNFMTEQVDDTSDARAPIIRRDDFKIGMGWRESGVRFPPTFSYQY